MLGSPFFSDFDDDYQYFQPHPSYYEQQRRAALRAQQEEARRRAELEHYFRMKAMEEERLRQQQEYERQLLQKAVMEERRRREQLLQAEKEEARRKKLLREEREAREEAERRDRMRALRFLSGDAMDENTDDDQSGSESEESSMGYHEEPIYELMRGPDGRVYRVPVGVKRIPRPVPQKFHQSKKENRSPFHSSMENGQKKTDVETNMKKTSNEVPTNPLENLMSHSTLLEQQGESKQTTKKTKKGKKNRNGKKKRIQVIVEDASDSETEDEFYKSPWRNRRPSPGAWIEPVEFFDRLP